MDLYFGTAVADSGWDSTRTDSGAQPLVYADGKKNLTCAVNGEIYNWKDLIKGLKNRDVPLVTGSDCEVIMHLVSRPFESRSTLTEAGSAATDHP